MKSVITGIAIFLGVILMFIVFGGFYPNDSKGFKDSNAQSQKLIRMQKEYILAKRSQINLTTSCPNKRGDKKEGSNSLLRETLKDEYRAKAIEVKRDNKELNALKRELQIAKERLSKKSGELQKSKSQLLLLKKEFKSTKDSTQKELSRIEELNKSYLQEKQRLKDARTVIEETQKRIKDLENELRMKDDRFQMLKVELSALKKEIKYLKADNTQNKQALKVASVEEPAQKRVEKENVKTKAEEKKITEVDKKIQDILSLRKVEFRSGSWELTKKSKKILLSVSEIIKENPNFHYIIEGHTDSSGNEQFNLTLSDKRANKVRVYLIKSGVDKNILTARGFGSSQPIADNATKEGRIKNRRVVIKIAK